MIEKSIIDIYKEKRYKINSPNNIDVDSHNVQKKITKGRTILLCDCDNSTNFTDNNLCRHKQFFLIFPIIDYFWKKLNSMENFYSMKSKMCKNSEVGFVCDSIVNEIKDIKRDINAN
jgi:hypothetical protein